jgi:SprT-like family protein
MKKLILITVFVLMFTKVLSPAVPDNLDAWYQGYNVALFNHELPDKILIDHDLRDDRFMALTEYENGFYHISFNRMYEPSPKQGRGTLIHEMCHVRQLISGELEFDDHGKKWQSCMHEIANKNGFEEIW